jgi:DNA-binding GntR family transcriptional regulator
MEVDDERAAQAARDFTKALHLAFSISREDFTDLLMRVLGVEFVTDFYADEHWDSMRADFAKWLSNLDREAQVEYFKMALEKYGLD